MGREIYCLTERVREEGRGKESKRQGASSLSFHGGRDRETDGHKDRGAEKSIFVLRSERDNEGERESGRAGEREREKHRKQTLTKPPVGPR